MYSQFLEFGQGLYRFGKKHQVVEVQISRMRQREMQGVSTVFLHLKVNPSLYTPLINGIFNTNMSTIKNC